MSRYYFQKSKVFLYPLLGITTDVPFTPSNTYIAWDKKYTSDSLKLICVYEGEKIDKKIEEFVLFYKNRILTHPLFQSNCSYEEDSKTIFIYVFDYSQYEEDFKNFLEGKYSKFNASVKNKLVNFFTGKGKSEYYIKSYLYPEQYHNEYSEELDVPLDIIKTAYELCSPPELKMETLFIIEPTN